MTVKNLKSKLEKLPSDTPVVFCDRYGQFCDVVFVGETKNCFNIATPNRHDVVVLSEINITGEQPN